MATSDELVAHCREHVAAYRLPRAIQFLERGPITASGKVMRRLLKDCDDGSRCADHAPGPVSGTVATAAGVMTPA